MATYDNRTWILPPPAERITPAVARRWLYRSYPPLGELTSMVKTSRSSRWQGSGMRRDERERLLPFMNIIDSDVRRIVVACGKALATGRAVPMVLEYPNGIRVDHRWNVRGMRSVLKYERCLPQRGTRGILQHALAVHEQLAKSEPRVRATR